MLPATRSHSLAGGRFAGPVRRGQVVLRPTTSATANTAALLQHLERAGFEQAPRHLGYTSDGREKLSVIEGDSALPPYVEAVRSDEALVNVARTIRRFQVRRPPSQAEPGTSPVSHRKVH